MVSLRRTETTEILDSDWFPSCSCDHETGVKLLLAAGTLRPPWVCSESHFFQLRALGCFSLCTESVAVILNRGSAAVPSPAINRLLCPKFPWDYSLFVWGWNSFWRRRFLLFDSLIRNQPAEDPERVGHSEAESLRPESSLHADTAENVHLLRLLLLSVSV